MKLLAFADTHGSYRLVQNIVQQASQVDLLLCVGDFTDWGRYGESLFEGLKDFSQPLLWVNGNHEEEANEKTKQLFQQYSFTQNIEGSIVHYGGLAFCGCSYSTATIYSPKSQHYAQLVELAAKVKETKPLVFLTHCPPAGCHVAYTKQRDAGSKRVRDFIEDVQPYLVLCGHIHKPKSRESYIGDSRIVNVACQHRILEINPNSIP